jgi:hypothetical protein
MKEQLNLLLQKYAGLLSAIPPCDIRNSFQNPVQQTKHLSSFNIVLT